MQNNLSPDLFRKANAALRAQTAIEALNRRDLSELSRRYRVDPAKIKEWLGRLEQDTARWRRRNGFR